MVIRVQCSCGSTLQAEDRFAGTRALCPYCRKTVVLPGPVVAPPPTRAEAPVAAAAKLPDTPPASTVPERRPDASAASAAAPVESEFRSTAPSTPSRPPLDDEPLDVCEFLDDPALAPAAEAPAAAAATSRSEASSSRGERQGAFEPASGGGKQANSPVRGAAGEPWARRMLLALLDPRAIQWLLVLGGGLTVLGVVIGLASLGVFKSPYVVAAGLGLGCLALHAGGCWTTLKTTHQTAGRALTFLACVLLPLNLWYYQHQGLMTLDGRLWTAAFVICWIFVGTVYVLRDPLFLFAVEAGVTLTALLLAASLGRLDDATYLSLTLLTLALVSIHAERAFAPDAAVFSRRRFGLNLFWSGHVQLAAALVVLATAQTIAWIVEPVGSLAGVRWTGTLLTDSRFVAGAVWLAGAYAYLYSDLVVRKLGLYTYLGAVCLMMAEITLIGFDLPHEALIAVMTLTAVGVNVALATAGRESERMQRNLAPLSLIVSFLAVMLGFVTHLRTTSVVVAELGWGYSTSWPFVGAMLVVALGNRLSAYLDRRERPAYAGAYVFLSATGLMIAAAGVLRGAGWTAWYEQAPALMLIPVGYLLASLARTERSVRGPLQWVAHAATAVILLSMICSSLEFVAQVLQPISGRRENLLAGLVFIEAAVFYATAAVVRRRTINVYLATLAGCLAIWQGMGYFDLPGAYYTTLYAVLGLTLLVAARLSGLAERSVFGRDGVRTDELTGAGAPFYRAGSAVLAAAYVAAALQGIARLLADHAHWNHLAALVLTTVAAALATLLARRGAHRWSHATGAIGLGVLTFLSFNVLLDIPLWRKCEVFGAAAGLTLLALAAVARFREEDGREEGEFVTLGLWLGSLVATVSLLATVMYLRITSGPSLGDELALLTVAMLMLAGGVGLQFKAPTICGGFALTLYLATVVVELAYSPQVAIGVYLAAGGALVFLAGVVLSVYRDKLLALPDQIAKREGVFRVFTWR